MTVTHKNNPPQIKEEHGGLVQVIEFSDKSNREETYADGTVRVYEDGDLKIEFLPDDTVVTWEKGVLRRKELIDHRTFWVFDENGNITHHPKGLEFYRALKEVARKHIKKGSKKNKVLPKKGKTQKAIEVSMAILKQRFKKSR